MPEDANPVDNMPMDPQMAEILRRLTQAEEDRAAAAAAAAAASASRTRPKALHCKNFIRPKLA